MRNILVVVALVGVALGVPVSGAAQIPNVSAGDTIKASDINAIIDALNAAGVLNGNIDLSLSTLTTGNITKNGVRFLHNFGGANTFLGEEAGNFTMTGIFNVATGGSALFSNTTGSGNVATGADALFSNTTGSINVAVGDLAGFDATTGSSNIYLGANVFGVAGESNTMYLGKVGTQTTTVIAGIFGRPSGPLPVAVMIGSNGQLGTVASSRRYKEHIVDMGEASRGLLDLRPVTFRYKEAYADGAKPIQYGLIAEEVSEVYPDLVVYNEDGQPETVQYHKVNAMLLNEVQRQHRQIEALMARLSEVERRLETN